MNSREYAGLWFHQRMDWAVLDKHLTEAQADELELMVKEFYADHWRDDDSPQAEITFGVRRAACAKD